MEKKDIKWSEIGFSYIKTDYRYSRIWENGEWKEGGLTDKADVTISECAGVLQYAQTGFEGLKVYETKNGDVVAFRPDLNAHRLQDTCDRLIMPKISTEDFIDALDRLVKANLGYVPPYGSGATLYIRPFIYGCGPVIGVAPSPSYEFRMFCTPVGPYFKGGVKPIKIMLSDYDRAAPHGTGNIKAGLNYAMSLYPGEYAHSQGFSENMYLDAATRTYVEETGGANFIFVTKDGKKIITPKSDSILPSITRRSLMVVAKEYLGLEVEERPVRFDEVPSFAEVGLCGTAAVISPVGMIHTKTKDILVPSGMDEMGPVLTKLRNTITGIQMGEIEGPEGWVHKIC